MTTRIRGGWPALLGAALLSTGCSLSSLMYFLMPEPKVPPGIRQVASLEEDKVPRVVILAAPTRLITDVELIQMDRQLCELLARHLHDLCEANKEYITIVAPAKVEQFKSSTPEWEQMHPAEVGRHFKADHVIFLEIGKVSLYEQGSDRTLYRGDIEISVSLVDVNRPDAAPDRQEFHTVYPSKAGPMAVDADTPPLQFRLAFLNHVARRLTWYFTGHSHRDAYQLD